MIQNQLNLTLGMLLISLTQGLESSAFRAKAWKHVRSHKFLYGGLTITGSLMGLYSLARTHERLEKPHERLNPSLTLEDGSHTVPVRYIQLPHGTITTPNANVRVQTALVLKTRKGTRIELETENHAPNEKTLYEWRMKHHITDPTKLVLDAWRKYDATKPNFEVDDTVKVFLPFEHRSCDISIERAWPVADPSSGDAVNSYIKITAQHRKIPEFMSYVYLATNNDTIDISVDDSQKPLPQKLHPLIAWIFYRDSFKVHSGKTVHHIEKRPHGSRSIRDVWNPAHAILSPDQITTNADSSSITSTSKTTR